MRRGVGPDESRSLASSLSRGNGRAGFRGAHFVVSAHGGDRAGARRPLPPNDVSAGTTSARTTAPAATAPDRLPGRHHHPRRHHHRLRGLNHHHRLRGWCPRLRFTKQRLRRLRPHRRLRFTKAAPAPVETAPPPPVHDAAPAAPNSEAAPPVTRNEPATPPDTVAAPHQPALNGPNAPVPGTDSAPANVNPPNQPGPNASSPRPTGPQPNQAAPNEPVPNQPAPNQPAPTVSGLFGRQTPGLRTGSAAQNGAGPNAAANQKQPAARW